MRAFILLAIIGAVRADVGGYNYGAGDSDSNVGTTLSGNTPPVDTPYDAYRGDAAVNQADQTHSEFTKEFYTFTAPENEFNDEQNLNDLSSSFKKSLRVVFIRGPENQHDLTDAALNLAKSAVNRKTAIYILNKQNDITQLAQKLHDLKQHSQSDKPEVHFVKYRTPKDAAYAQHAIQQQYDNLGGTTHSHDGGIAQVLNFASHSQHSSSSEGGISNHGSLGDAAIPSAAYLPIRF